MEENRSQTLDVEEIKQVLDATFDLLGAEGLNADVVERVSARTGIPPTRIYLHFGGPSRLMQALMERELEVVAGSVAVPELRFPGETIGDELNVLARILLDECRTHAGFLGTSLKEAMKNPEFAEVFYRTFILRGRKLFTEFLNTRRERDEIRAEIDIEAAAAFFLSALIFSVLALEILGGKAVERVDDARLVAGMSDLFLRGILPR
ncbi:MAG: TetR/AcrR family transcriptional regulator C-terminal ligand-binding domain-containing protein [Acidobacteriota bacterium]